jgi:hypothetical protein
MKWCKLYVSCLYGRGCARALTPEVIKEAEKWWGKEGAPICQYMGKPDCYKFESPKKGGTNE